MKRPPLVVLMAVAVLMPRRAAADGRDQHRHSKGMELYSWRDWKGEWEFAVVPGTNGLKSRAQIKALKYRIVGVPALEVRLAHLAEGEDVSWVCHQYDFECPDSAIVTEIAAAAAKARINLSLPSDLDSGRK